MYVKILLYSTLVNPLNPTFHGGGGNNDPPYQCPAGSLKLHVKIRGLVQFDQISKEKIHSNILSFILLLWKHNVLYEFINFKSFKNFSELVFNQVRK